MKHIKNKSINIPRHLSRHVKFTRLLGQTLLYFGCLIWLPIISKAQVEGPPSETYINVSEPDNGDKYCPVKGVQFTAPTNFLIPKYGYITYSWTFDQADNMTTYVSASNQINYDPNPPLIRWEQEGTFTVTVTVTTHFPNGAIAQTFVGTVDIVINATCCQSQLRNEGRDLTPPPPMASVGISGTMDGVWLISENVTVTNNVEFTGLLLVDGEAITNTSGPGGTVIGKHITLNPSVEFKLTGGEIRAACDEMWGGIEASEDSRVSFSEGALMKDSWDGIHPNPSNTTPYYFDIQDSEFFNNRIAMEVEDVDLNTGNYLLRDNLFDADYEIMLSPYEFNIGHNVGSAFTMEVGLNIRGNSEMTNTQYWRANTFKNALVGIHFRPSGFLSESITSHANDFYNNLIVALYAQNADIVRVSEISEFQVPTNYLPSSSLSNYQITTFLSGPNVVGTLNNSVVGIATFGNNELVIENALIFQDISNPDPTFSSPLERVGINAISGSGGTSYVEVSNSTISNMNKGISLSIVSDLFLEKNISTDNQYHYFVGNSIIPLHIDMTCNATKITSAVSTVQTYGLYVPSGSFINGDIGGPGGFSSPAPAGNGWPVDPSSTGYNADPPYTNLGGTTVNVSNWSTPNNWDAIHDANSNPGWTYWRYDNEYVGEHDGGTFPSTIVNNPNTNPQTLIAPGVCPASLDIIFPQAIILQFLEEANAQSLSVYPNPISSGQSVNLTGIEIDDVSQILLIDMNGRGKVVNWPKRSGYLNVDLPVSVPGEYLIRVSLLSGEYEICKLIIQ